MMLPADGIVTAHPILVSHETIQTSKSKKLHYLTKRKKEKEKKKDQIVSELSKIKS